MYQILFNDSILNMLHTQYIFCFDNKGSVDLCLVYIELSLYVCFCFCFFVGVLPAPICRAVHRQTSRHDSGLQQLLRV